MGIWESAKMSKTTLLLMFYFYFLLPEAPSRHAGCMRPPSVCTGAGCPGLDDHLFEGEENPVGAAQAAKGEELVAGARLGGPGDGFHRGGPVQHARGEPGRLAEKIKKEG